MRLAQFGKIATSDRIDSKNGIIFGVSVISEGEALGHDVWIDAKTLRQVKATASTYAGGLKVKMNHYSGVDAVVGTLQNFRIKEQKLLADLHLLQSAEPFDKILEMAAKMPESFGLSIVFDNEPELIEKVNYARCKEIYSCDIVDNPAANPSGLFEIPNKNTMNKEILKALGLGDTATQAEYDAALLALAKKKNDHDADDVKYEKDGKTHSSACMCKACKSEMEAKKPLAAFETKITDLATKLEALEKKDNQATALAKKAEIDNLMAEAARDGKVVPLDNDDLYTVKDGVTTIKTEPAQLSKIISKLSKNQVKTTRQTTVPKNDKGEQITDRRSDAFKSFMATKKQEGALALNRQFAEINQN